MILVNTALRFLRGADVGMSVRWGGYRLIVDEPAGGDARDITGRSVDYQILFVMKMPISPLATRCVRAEKNHGDGCCCDADEGDDEGHPPRNMI